MFTAGSKKMAYNFFLSSDLIKVRLVALIVMILLPTQTVAQVTGQTRFSGGNFQFYHGGWTNVYDGGSAGGCSMTGQTRYSSSRIEYCNGSSWRSTNTGVSDGPCSVSGLLDYRNNMLQYCNGTTWIQMELVSGNIYTCDYLTTFGWVGPSSVCSPLDSDCTLGSEPSHNETRCCSTTPSIHCPRMRSWVCASGEWEPFMPGCVVTSNDPLCSSGSAYETDTACCKDNTHPSGPTSNCIDSGGGPL